MFDRYQVVTQKPFEVSSGDCIDGCGDGAICSFCMIYNGGFPRNYFPSRTYPRVVLIDEDAISGRSYKLDGQFLWIDGKLVNVSKNKPSIIMGVLIEKDGFDLKFSVHGKEITFEEFKSSFET